VGAREKGLNSSSCCWDGEPREGELEEEGASGGNADAGTVHEESLVVVGLSFEV